LESSDSERESESESDGEDSEFDLEFSSSESDAEPDSEDSESDSELVSPRESLSELNLVATDGDRGMLVAAGLTVLSTFKVFFGDVFRLTDGSDRLSDELDLDVDISTVPFKLDASAVESFSPALDFPSESDFPLSLSAPLSESELADEDVSDVSSSSLSNIRFGDLDWEVAEVSLS